jgi:hypothetical protein
MARFQRADQLLRKRSGLDPARTLGRFLPNEVVTTGVTALPRANRAGAEIVPLTTKSIGKEPASLLLSMQAPEVRRRTPLRSRPRSCGGSTRPGFFSSMSLAVGPIIRACCASSLGLPPMIVGWAGGQLQPLAA